VQELRNSSMHYVNTINKDGSWSDIVYHPTPNPMLRDHWPPAVHVTRVEFIATCFATKEVPQCFKSARILPVLERALDFWFRANLTNTYNWYMPAITVPIAVGRACVMMDDVLLQSGSTTAAAEAVSAPPPTGLPANTRAGCARVMLQADWSTIPFGMSNITGANLVWMATSRVYRGLLLSNASEVLVATNRIFAELCVITPAPSCQQRVDMQ
jgi:hypothetical protein